MRLAYSSLHADGLAQSNKEWLNGELDGGQYGYAIGRMFFGESMFARRTDASKIAVVRLAGQLDRWGFPLIDCQLETEHLASLGAETMPRREFVAEVRRLVTEPAAAWTLDPDLAGSLIHAPRILRSTEE
jgi:leucyl/phenylalanyl-tRNA--protein transferase